MIRLMTVGAINWRWRGLERVDKELSRRNYESALSLVKKMKAKPHGLRAFGSVKLVPGKVPFSDGDSTEFQSLVDSVMNSIQKCMESASAEEISPLKSLQNINNKEKPESLLKKEEQDRFMVVQHESGHFLVGYLLGVLPRHYEIPKLEALRSNDSRLTGRIAFMGFEFLNEVDLIKKPTKDNVNGKVCQKNIRGKISSKTLNNFSCVILGGLVADHMFFGYSEGLYSDVDTLNSVLRWLGYTEIEARKYIKWAASNTVFYLLSHRTAIAQLAEAMCMAKSIGHCIDIIETELSISPLLEDNTASPHACSSSSSPRHLPRCRNI